ncbi:unnamed protein product [Ophioblennius macclurei]
MDKNSVTRAFSIGAIGSGTNTLDDFSTARRHSSAGIRALLWATNSARSFGCSTDSQTSFENIFPNILTPNSIPQFTIPTLSVQTSSRSWNEDNNANPDGIFGISEKESTMSSASSSSSSSSSRLNLALSDRRAERSVSDPLAKGKPLLHRDGRYYRSYKEDQQCLDPLSKAALSLPHLAKVTTPYGFVTLSQSPQMANEEVLLNQTGPRCAKQDNKPLSRVSRTPGTGVEEGKGKFSHLSAAKRKTSRESADSQTKARVQGELKTSSPSSGKSSVTVTQSSTPKQPDAKLKRHFYGVIRKYFISHHLK